ncbi:MAG: flavin monoamine oxidase family protein [Gemmatimonadota bacterium]|nr:flavin monoamine oxidase family protein [Gemmatimonadota bacterium]
MKRRDFLQLVGRAGGAGAVYQAMGAMGVLHKPLNTPLDLSGNGRGKKVLILGAGLAGMSAGYELRKLGYDCHILEARGRPGGRCHSIRQGTVETEIDGATQTCQFDKGLYYNPGPMRVPADHLTTLNYCKEFDLALEAFLNVNENAYYHSADPKFSGMSGGKLRHREAKADMFGYTDELMAKATSEGALDKDLSKDDRDALMQFFQSDGWLQGFGFGPPGAGGDTARAVLPKYGPNMRRGFEVQPGGGTNSGKLSKPVDRHTLYQSRVFFNFGYEQYIDFQMTMMQLAGGTDRLAYAFAERLGNVITYNAPIREIRNDGAGVRVVYKGAGGITREEKAEYCICTIPFSVLKSIPNDFPAPVNAAISTIGGQYAVTGKMGLQFKRRFWEEDDRIFGGVTLTDQAMTQIVYPSTGFQSKKGVLIGYYNYDQQADEFAKLSPADRVKRALAEGRKIHPQYDAEFESGISVAWHKTPYSLGGWANWNDTQRQNEYALLLKPQGGTYFCGEHMSYVGSWMAGAFESSHETIKMLHARASSA